MSTYTEHQQRAIDQESSRALDRLASAPAILVGSVPAKRFRTDNTQGYDRTDLAALNAAWATITSHGALADDSDDWATQSMLDFWSQQLLAAFDRGARGDDLVAWFYAP